MSSSSSGPLRGEVSVENTATAPVDGAMRATAPTPGVASVAMNQRLPSGPGVICLGWGTIDGYSVTIDPVPAQLPPWQESPVVQALPSLQAVPSGALGLVQLPVAGLHVPATWH